MVISQNVSKTKPKIVKCVCVCVRGVDTERLLRKVMINTVTRNSKKNWSPPQKSEHEGGRAALSFVSSPAMSSSIEIIIHRGCRARLDCRVLLFAIVSLGWCCLNKLPSNSWALLRELFPARVSDLLREAQRVPLLAIAIECMAALFVLRHQSRVEASTIVTEARRGIFRDET